MNRLSGRTDQGISYYVVVSPDDGPPVVLEFDAPPGMHWTTMAGAALIGQSFGMRWNGRPLLLHVVGATFNAMTKRMQVTCR